MSKRYIPTDAQVAGAQKLWADENLQAQMRKCIDINAEQIMAKLPRHLVRGELEQSGWVGAWMGACKYDPSCDTKPFTYIYSCIRGEMMHYVRGIARERGCPAHVWERREFDEYEFSMADLDYLDRTRVDNIEDRTSAVCMNDTLDGDWKVFRDGLSPRLRSALDGMLGGLTPREAMAKHGSMVHKAHDYCDAIRFLWRSFVRSREIKEERTL